MGKADLTSKVGTERGGFPLFSLAWCLMLCLFYIFANPMQCLTGEGKMDLSDNRMLELLEPLMPLDRSGEAVVYLDTQLMPQGASIRLGSREYQIPFVGYFLFVDLMPEANWSHPAMGVFISREGDKVSSVKVEFPPFFGDPPATYRRLSLENR